MKSENYFIKKLEEQLSDSENIKLFREMKDGKNNQELILLRNLNLVKIVVEIMIQGTIKMNYFKLEY